MEWALELSSFGLKFESTSTIQSRVLAEFIAEWTSTPDEEIHETTLPDKETSRDWIMYFDGAFSLQGAGAGVCYLSSMRWFSLEEERVMQQSSVSISLSF